MATQGLVLNIDEMKEAVADWAEKTTGKRPDLDDVGHSSWGQGQWWFSQSPWEKLPTQQRTMT